MLQLVYVSRRARSLSVFEIARIIEASERKNRQAEISVAMLCCGNHIMQLLEGDPDKVEPLFAAIAADPRHQDVTLLLRKEVRKRLFPDWGMLLEDLARGTIVHKDRLQALLEDVRSRIDTRDFSVEARMLINDFKLQVETA